MAESSRKITVEIEDRRAEGDPVTNDARHFASVLTKKGLTVDALGSEEAPLRREGDNRDEMVAAVRKEYAREANFTVTKNPDEVVEESLAPANNGSLERNALEQVEIDARLLLLVVQPINALSEAQRTVKGRVRSGVEIARAIPDVAAFLNEVTLQNQNGILLDFFELNETGQLVMKDDCPEAYGLGENALQAKIRQTRIVYRDENDQTKVMTGEECFNVTERDKESRPLKMEVSEAARNIDPKSILMVRGLPTLKWEGGKHTEEYARMNTGQLESSKITWTDDDSLGSSYARDAAWDRLYGRVYSEVYASDSLADRLGSRGVLRVNLNLES